MFDFTSQFFWYKMVFAAELLVAEILFICKLNKKKHFFVRFFLSSLAFLALTFLIPVPFYNAVYSSLVFVVVFLLSLVAMKLYLDEPWWNIFFCGIAAYTVQHFSYVLYAIVVDLFSLNEIFVDGGAFNPYLQSGIGSISPLAAVAYFDVYFVVYWAAYFILADRIDRHENLHLGNKRFVLLAGLICQVDVIFNMITSYNTGGNTVSLYLERVYNLLTCVLAVRIQFGRLSEKEIRGELDVLSRLLYEQKKQYEMTKENIDIINVKCHDLKHQIRALRLGDKAIEDAQLEEIENAVNIYQSVVSTGNEALDVILTEKSLYCEKNHITFSCIVDGSLLSFMSASDMYSLFGNAIDNAVEAVMKIEESKRNISFSVKSVGKFVSVHLENYFSGELKRNGDRIETSKEDKNFHGFGMMSIKVITEKYGGTCSVEIVKDVFNLNLLFPMQEKQTATK